jgi:hypothetical protein
LEFGEKLYICRPIIKIGALSSVGSEHLVYTQRVGGSNPSAPTSLQRDIHSMSLFLFL